MKLIVFFSVLSAIICFNTHANAEEHHKHREHGPHVHGKAKLDIAIEKDEIEATLDIPGMNLIGFEGKPRNEKQKHTLAKITDMFNKTYNLFLIADEAGCSVNSRKLEGKEDEDHDHTDYEYSIKYKCKDISKIKQLDVNLFRDLDTLKEVTVELITETAQKELKIYPTKSKIDI